MNDLQKRQLDMLREFIRICTALGLRYFLVCGSALGAVKYRGFIPWDDDVDVALLREDYEIFVREAPGLLADGLFLQNHVSDPNFMHLYSKLRSLGTTYIERPTATIDYCHGVFIDIFPLDTYPKTPLFELRKWVYTRVLCLYYDHDVRWKRWVCVPLRAVLRRLGVFPFVLRRYTSAIVRARRKDTARLCNFGSSYLRLEYAPREQYGDGAEAEFEGLAVRIPARCAAYLTQKYGDWRAELPEEQRVGHHLCTVCDLERPYTVYTHRPQGRRKGDRG